VGAEVATVAWVGVVTGAEVEAEADTGEVPATDAGVAAAIGAGVPVVADAGVAVTTTGAPVAAAA
jgi:hypothetical protein